MVRVALFICLIWSAPGCVLLDTNPVDMQFPQGLLNWFATSAAQPTQTPFLNQWVELSPTGHWSARSSHMSVVYDNGVHGARIWVLSGDTAATDPDVWSSPDGENWMQHTTPTNWDERGFGIAAAIPSGPSRGIYVFAGFRPATPNMDDVISSTDGDNWTVHHPNDINGIPFPGRREHTGVHHNGKLFLLSGWTGGVNSQRTDVYSSEDGVTWNQIWADNADNITPYAQRRGACLLSYQGALWLIGGMVAIDVFVTDVLRSTDDGNTWSVVGSTAGIGRRRMACAVYKNRIMLLGGGVAGGGATQDIWTTSDANNWESFTAPWPARESFTAVVLNGRLYVMGGGDGGTRNDVWEGQ